jgi:hypothetical protein
MRYVRLYEEKLDPFIEKLYQKALKTISGAAAKEKGNFRVPFGAYVRSVTSRLSPYNVKTPERLKEMGFDVKDFHMTLDGNYMPNDETYSNETKNLLGDRSNEAFFASKKFKDRLLEDLKKMFPSYIVSQFGDNDEYKTILPFLKTDSDRYFYFDKKLMKESTEENATKKVVRLIETLMDKYPDQRVLYVPVDAYVKSIWKHNHQDIRYVEKFIDGVIKALDKYEVNYRYGKLAMSVPQFSPEDERKLFGGKGAFHVFIVGRKELTEDTEYLEKIFKKITSKVDEIIKENPDEKELFIPLDSYFLSMKKNLSDTDYFEIERDFVNRILKHYRLKGWWTDIVAAISRLKDLDYLGNLKKWTGDNHKGSIYTLKLNKRLQ